MKIIKLVTLVHFHCGVYVRVVDATYEKALKGGCITIQVPTYNYPLDKVAKVVDQFGIMWLIATFNASI